MESTAGLKALKLFQHFSWSLWTQHPLRFPLNNFLKTIPWFSISKTKTEEKKILPVLQVNSKICFNFQVDLARWKKPIILKIWKHLFFFFFVSLLDLRMKSSTHLTDVLPFLCCALITGVSWHFSPSCIFGGFIVNVKMEQVVGNFCTWDQCSHKSYKDSHNFPIYFRVYRSSLGV